ncbi:uncharacterized protein LOC134273340 [Saccostrea cucullata]|uniref:uncharacterized protein LOC134273340 n=1 Tax=Saccostrea cuccullata TaxID=36930 RepID=UPI002ED4DDA3
MVGGKVDEEDNMASKSLVWYPLLRSLFSVSGDYKEMDSEALRGRQCSNDQIYDSSLGICRNITCFPGKYLSRGESCIPLFSITKNLRYNLDITFDGFSINNISEEDIEDLVTDFIPFKIKKTVKLTQNLFFNIFRIEYVQKKYGKFQGWIQSTIFINESVHRLKTERLLIQFTKTKLKYICSDTFILFDFKKKYFSVGKNHTNRMELEGKDRSPNSTDGAIWLLQILDGLLPPSYFSYIISVLNTSHGVFIFLGFVCNKRTILMYKKTFKDKAGITNSTDLQSACETPRMLKSETSF